MAGGDPPEEEQAADGGRRSGSVLAAGPPGPGQKRSGFLSSGTFDALRYRDYRLLWFAQVGSAMAQQSEMLTRTWLVIELTNSAVAVGLVHFTRALGSIAVTPIAGVLADRIDRRYVLIAANVLNAFFFTLLAVLYLTGLIEVWHTVVSAIIAGASQTVQNTGMQSIVPNVVPRERLMNAMGLQSTIMGASRVVGPLSAGVMLAFTGIAGSYLLMTVLLAFPIAMYLAMKPIRAQSGERVSFWTSFREGMAFASRTPSVRVVMLVSITVVTLGMPFLQLMPVYVKDVLDEGPLTLSLIVSIPGLLTIAGGLVAASLGDFKYKGRLLLLSVLSPPIAAIIMALTSSVPATFLAACVFGALSSQFQPATQSSVMKATPDHLRGRVASLISMVQNLGSFGVVLYGVVADLSDIQFAYLVFGIAAGGLQLIYFAGMKSYRTLT